MIKRLLVLQLVNSGISVRSIGESLHIDRGSLSVGVPRKDRPATPLVHLDDEQFRTLLRQLEKKMRKC